MLNIFRKRVNKEINFSETAEVENKNADTLAEVAAVISYALHLYQQDIHDYENMILTIQKVVRPYSPWSSKIYGLRQIPRR
jgi:predicted metal-dependent enzyme (double-stranded beta helix superfamily)